LASRVGLIRQLAAKYGLDPDAVLAIASHEGPRLSWGATAIGDNGTSFGPFQLHAGGALPPYARGLQGQAAVQAISQGFERPADVAGEVRDAMAHYGKIGGGRQPRRMPPGAFPRRGAPGGKARSARSGLPPGLAAGVQEHGRGGLLQQSAAGGSINSSGLLALAMARRQLGAAQQTFGAQPTKAPLVSRRASRAWRSPSRGASARRTRTSSPR
jgi:hypothetical protein